MAHAMDLPTAWTVGEHLLATTVELAQETNLLLLRAHFEQVGAAPELQRIPRPGAVPEPEPEPMTIHDVRRALLGSPIG